MSQSRSCRIAYTGPEPPPRELRERVYWVPLLTVEPVKGASRELLKARHRGGPKLIVVTSPRTPRFLALDAIEHGVYQELRKLVEESVVAAVGPFTLREAERLLGAPNKKIVPGYWSVESLAGELLDRGERYSIALVLRASSPSPSYKKLMEALGSIAGAVEEVIVYRNTPLRSNAELLAGMIREGLVDVIAVSSPLQARLLAEALHGEQPRAGLAVIGRATRRAVEEAGLKAGVEAQEPSVAALMEAASLLCRS